MQRQTGSRIKPLPVPDTPSIAPADGHEDKVIDTDNAIARKSDRKVLPHSGE